MIVEEKRAIYEAFIQEQVEVQSVTKDKKLEWKLVKDVMRHDVSKKKQFKITIERDISCVATEDHSFFIDGKEKIKEYKTKDFKIDDPLVFIENSNVTYRNIVKKEEVIPEKYMYDLSVQDNENFVLDSGILAHNSFRPPSSEQFIQAQTQVFGYVWEDYELYEYLLMAVDFFNTAPPVTSISLTQTPDRWRSVVLLKAASIACGALALNWIVDEYSVKGDEVINIKDEEGFEYSIEIKELHTIIYGELIEDVCKRADMEFSQAMQLIKEWEDEIK